MNMIDVPKIDKVQEILKARKEILELPKGRMISDVQAPSPLTIIPSRAFSDKYILTHPSALQVLGVICSYCNGQSGIAYPNQATVAKRLARSQPAISRQFNNLIKWGYIEKVRKENPLRNRGPKGASWRVIYDPGIDQDQLAQITTDPRVEANKAQDTIKEIVKEQVKEEKKQNKLSPAQDKLANDITQKYLKDETEFFPYDLVYNAMVTYLSGKQTIDAWNKIGCGLLSPIEKGYLKESNITPNVIKQTKDHNKNITPDVITHKSKYNTRCYTESAKNITSDVMQNYNTITNNNIIKDKVFEYLRSYSHALDDICKTRGQWRWTKREEAIAEQMIEAGVKIDAFMKEVIKVLNRCKKNRSRPPYTIAFFKSMWQNKVSKPKDTKQLIKGLANKMNKRYDGV